MVEEWRSEGLIGFPAVCKLEGLCVFPRDLRFPFSSSFLFDCGWKVNYLLGILEVFR